MDTRVIKIKAGEKVEVHVRAACKFMLTIVGPGSISIVKKGGK